MDRRLKIRHVQCFVEASNSLHLADVSSKLNLTQAAVSKTISELEEIVGEPLIKRLRSGIKLTPAGIIESLDLRKPIYKETAKFGHFGRDGFSWEKTDKAEALKAAASA